MEGAPERFRSQEISGPSGGGPPASSGDWHNRRTARARDAAARFSLDQVVYDYGDLFQAIMELAVDRRASIDVDEFRTLNRCLDDAIAEAAVEFTYQHDLSFADRRVKAFNERLGSLAHEMRNLIHTATLVFTAIKAGNVGMAGASGAVLDRSLVAMRQLVERALADVRVPAELPARHEILSVADLIAELETGASLEAHDRGCQLAVAFVDPDMAVDADRDMLMSAVGNLLQNASNSLPSAPRFRCAPTPPAIAFASMSRTAAAARPATQRRCSCRSRNVGPIDPASDSDWPSAGGASRRTTGLSACATDLARGACSQSICRGIH